MHGVGINKPKKVLFVVNPSAGKDFPILAAINRQMIKDKIDWDLILTKHNQPIILNNGTKIEDYCCVGVYGGDGTVNKLAQLLLGKKVPLLILPGGTANMLATELGLDQDIEESLSLLTSEKINTRQINTATVNGNFFINLSLVGPLARLNQDTTREMKDALGVFAYAQTFFSKISLDKSFTSIIKIDDQDWIQIDGAGFLVLNSRLVSIGGISFTEETNLMHKSILLVVLPRMSFREITEAIFQFATNQNYDEISQKWLAEKIEIKLPERKTIICDETEFSSSELIYQLNPQPLTVILPRA